MPADLPDPRPARRALARWRAVQKRMRRLRRRLLVWASRLRRWSARLPALLRPLPARLRRLGDSRRLRAAAGLFAVLALTVAGRYWLFWQRLEAPLNLEERYVLMVNAGSNFTRLVRELRQAGVLADEDLLYYVRYHGLANQIRAGEYELLAGLTPLGLLQLLLDGRVIEYQVRLGEGWTLMQAVTAIQSHPAVVTTVPVEDAAGWQQALGTLQYPEGWLFPETYNFTRGTRDVDLARRAQSLMQQTLEAAWAERDPGLPYQSPYDVLIMASIIEKETGLLAEQPQISGVFLRRLQQQMKLQTDPTVIYGLGASFDGNLTRAQLQGDTPYNTYLREGLPPTPIALPSRNALLATVHPAAGAALYFVAKGDGSHYFSATLEEHNAAVRQYQLKTP
jgi:UPF0755 protein